jgi:hypothetical protein
MSLLDSASLIVTPNGYKAGKLYSIVPSSGAGDFGVTRATTATRVNSSGLIESVASNVPRIDYTDGSCPSILVEPQRTNLLLRSEEFESDAWVKFNSTISTNTTTAPNGIITADKLVENANNSTHFAAQTVNVAANAIFTYSIFAKSAERNIIYFGGLGRMPNSNEGFVWFDLNLGLVLSSTGGFTGSIEPINNGWFRISVTSVASPTSTQREFRIGCSIADNIQAYQGNGTSGIYLWGAQLEAGSNATSYIPTTSASVTRNADVISKTGITGITTITETFEDNTTNVITGSPTSYTMSNGRIKQVIGL